MIAVVNGVNLNLLGRRDPGMYGSLTLQLLESRVYEWARDQGVTARCFQTNHEGELIDTLHAAVDWAKGVILNPGAWTHYSYALRDAVEFVELQDVSVVEVHLSNIDQREEFRRHSVLTGVASHRVIGQGPEGYRQALTWLVEHGAPR
jgi:3-dehydroquinate dehydratase II